MDEIEIPMEKIHEDIHHAMHISNQDSHSFINQAALLSALLAVFAAISALFAGHYSNEAMMEQIQSSNHWSHYQSKGIKRAISELRAENNHLESNSNNAAKANAERYRAEQDEIKEQAEEKSRESIFHLKIHQGYAMAVTFFQVSIAMTAIAVLAKKRRFFYSSLVLGLLGLIWMIITVLRTL